MTKRKGNAASRGTTPAQDLDNVARLSETPSETLRNDSPSTSSSPTPPAFTDDANWEDEPEYNLAYPHQRSPPPDGINGATSPPRSVRKRKAVSGRKLFNTQSTSTRKSYNSKKELNENVPPLINIDREQLTRGLHGSVAYTADYVLNVLKMTLKFLQKPIGILLFLYILALLLAQVQSAFRKVFSPICWIPGIASTPMCYVPSPPPKVPKWADYPKLAEMETSTFEQLLDETVGGTGLSLEIKKAEMATADLITLVKQSKLKGKDSLADQLRAFVDAAKTAGRGLTRLSSRVSGAVDSIIAVNDHALHTIEEALDKEKSSLSIFRPFTKAVMTQHVVATTFGDAMSVLSGHMARIVMEAEVSMKNLDRLEEMLHTLHEIVTRENNSITAEKEQLLAELWTILGGNRRELHSMDFHLYLLRHIGQYRMRAAAHVAAALQALQGMSEDMEDLRERVTAPELLGDRIPVEVHLKSIKSGLDRLQATRTKAQQREEDTVRKLLGDVSEFQSRPEIDS